MDLEPNDRLLAGLSELLLSRVIRQLCTLQTPESARQPTVSRAACAFVTRNANALKAVRAFRTAAADQTELDVYVVDAVAILRMMFDAYLQLRYVLEDPAESDRRARDYFDFADVDRWRLSRYILNGSHVFATRVRESELRAEHEPELRQRFLSLSSRFPDPHRPDDRERTRSHWYPGNMRQLAISLDHLEEYDFLFRQCSLAVHASWLGLTALPMHYSEAEFMASAIATWCVSAAREQFTLDLTPNEEAYIAAFPRSLADWRDDEDETSEHQQ